MGSASLALCLPISRTIKTKLMFFWPGWTSLTLAKTGSDAMTMFLLLQDSQLKPHLSIKQSVNVVCLVQDGPSVTSAMWEPKRQSLCVCQWRCAIINGYTKKQPSFAHSDAWSVPTNKALGLRNNLATVHVKIYNTWREILTITGPKERNLSAQPTGPNALAFIVPSLCITWP